MATTHTPHVDMDARPEALVDGCPRCEEHVETWMATLDGAHIARLWNRMLEVERYEEGHYASSADAKVGRHMYRIACFLQRAGFPDPWMPMEATSDGLGYRFVELVP